MKVKTLFWKPNPNIKSDIGDVLCFVCSYNDTKEASPELLRRKQVIPEGNSLFKFLTKICAFMLQVVWSCKWCGAVCSLCLPPLFQGVACQHLLLNQRGLLHSELPVSWIFFVIVLRELSTGKGKLLCGKILLNLSGDLVCRKEKRCWNDLIAAKTPWPQRVLWSLGGSKHKGTKMFCLCIIHSQNMDLCPQSSALSIPWLNPVVSTVAHCTAETFYTTHSPTLTNTNTFQCDHKFQSRSTMEGITSDKYWSLGWTMAY